MNNIQISKELEQKVQKYLRDNPISYYVDYQDHLSLEQVQQLMDDSQKVSEQIWNDTFEWQFEEEKNLMEELQQEFPELEEYEPSDLREEFLDYFQYEGDVLKDLMKHTRRVRIRVILQNNCEAMTDKLFNEEENKLVQYLKVMNGKTNDDYFNSVTRLLKGKYDVNSMLQEIENCTSSWNQLIFYFEANVADLMDINNEKERPWTKIHIPKYVMCGLYDSANGGGSVLEVKLTKDFWLQRKYQKYNGTHIDIVLDEGKGNSYAVEEVYGICDVPKIELKVK